MVRDRAVPALEDLPDALTIPEAAAVLRWGRNSMYEAVKQKRVASIRLGRKLLVPKRAIERMLDEAAAGGDGVG